MHLHYTDYSRRFRSEYAKFRLEPGAREVGPFLQPTLPSSPPWSMDWAVIYADGKFAYLKERWVFYTRNVPRAANIGFRNNFSFHYGTASATTDQRGIPERDPKNHPPIIRIDSDRHGPHMHFGGKHHIAQAKVLGITITNADPFDFMRAVTEYRAKNGTVNFDSILNFRVLP